MLVQVLVMEWLELIPVQSMTLILRNWKLQPVQCVLNNERPFARPLGRPCVAVLVEWNKKEKDVDFRRSGWDSSSGAEELGQYRQQHCCSSAFAERLYFDGLPLASNVHGMPPLSGRPEPRCLPLTCRLGPRATADATAASCMQGSPTGLGKTLLQPPSSSVQTTMGRIERRQSLDAGYRLPRRRFVLREAVNKMHPCRPRLPGRAAG